MRVRSWKVSRRIRSPAYIHQGKQRSGHPEVIREKAKMEEECGLDLIFQRGKGQYLTDNILPNHEGESGEV